MTNTLIKKLRGFQKAPRDRFLLLSNNVLNQEEFVVYELGIAITDWDTEHIETYGTFCATNLEIANVLGWKSDTTVSRIKSSLITKGLFSEANKRTKVIDFEKWQLRKYTPANKQPSPANIGVDNANPHEVSAKMQTVSPQRPKRPLGSFKGNVSVIRTEEEYQRIWKVNFDSSPSFTPDDMKWIDLNVYETAGVPS